MRDPYETLGVKHGTGMDEIKKAYRKLARDLHPDLHPGDKKAEERFKDITASYDFLSDADRKAKYDRGEIDPSGTPKQERRFYRDFADSGASYRYSDPEQFYREFEGSNIFSDLFRGARHDAHAMRGADIHHDLELGLVEAVNGGAREIVLPGGRRLKVTIPPASKDGDVLRLKGQGMAGPGGGNAGDLHVQLRLQAHPQFRREGNDIHAELPISLPEAVLGGRVEIQTVDGPVSLTIPAGSNTGTRLRVRGKGVPKRHHKERGDHYVTLKVILPETMDDDLVRFMREWQDHHPYRVRGR